MGSRSISGHSFRLSMGSRPEIEWTHLTSTLGWKISKKLSKNFQWDWGASLEQFHFQLGFLLFTVPIISDSIPSNAWVWLLPLRPVGGQTEHLEIEKTNSTVGGHDCHYLVGLRSIKVFIENPIHNLESIKFYEKFASGGSCRCDQDLRGGIWGTKVQH